MSCVTGPATFRLLDRYTGWEVDSAQYLTGFDDAVGVRLEQLSPGAVDPLELLSYLSPAPLARGCAPCEWYLAASGDQGPRLLHRERCSLEWRPVWTAGTDGPLADPVAIAVHDRRIAVSDRGLDRVFVWRNGGDQLLAAIPVRKPGAIALTPWGELLLAAEGLDALLRFSPTGDPRGRLPLPSHHTVERIAAGHDCAIWIVLRVGDRVYELWRATRDEPRFRKAATSELAASLPSTNIRAASAVGFCFEESDDGGVPVNRCFSWQGCPLDEGDVKGPEPLARRKQGQLLTKAIASGFERCEWHRVRIDADMPPGTTIEVKVATVETLKGLTSQGDSAQEGDWSGFPAGVPHTSDWQRPPAGSTDFLIQQPPGQYLFLCLRLSGNGHNTPVVRRICLDFPRITSLESLPSVYRENTDAEDFTARFLSLFDSSIEDLDRLIERYPALLDPNGVPEQVLPWLGSFLDIVFDQSWKEERRRAILDAAPELYKLRGTVEGMKLAVRLVFGEEPSIEELGPQRPWAGLRSGSVLGAVRLFGAARARFRVGRSALSKAPLRSYGNPDQDPLSAGAHRFRVLLPPLGQMTPQARTRLQELVDSQKPAHTVAATRVGGMGLVLGYWSAVGVDTVFAALPAPVLGKSGNVRLRRMSILWPGPNGPRAGFVLGRRTAVGIETVME